MDSGPCWCHKTRRNSVKCRELCWASIVVAPLFLVDEQPKDSHSREVLAAVFKWVVKQTGASDPTLEAINSS